VLEEALLRAVVAGAGQARKPYQKRNLRLVCLWREVKVEFHLTAGGRGIVGELEKLSAKRGYGGGGFDRHLGLNERSMAATIENSGNDIFQDMRMLIYLVNDGNWT
jgi:hypothetical protein